MKKRKYFFIACYVISFVLLAACLGYTAESQQSDEASEPQNEEEDKKKDEERKVIVTAVHRNITEKKFTRSVTVITEEDMDKTKVDTIAEAVRNVPGVTLRNQGGPGRLTTVQVRGGLARQTLVLFDGVQSINSPTVGTADLGSFYNTGIEQIEIIRGASGVIHSSRAQAGVINIITKRGKGDPEFDAMAEFGTNETFRETASLSGSVRDPLSLPLEEIYYAFSATRVDSEGIGVDNRFGNTYFTTRVGADVNENINFDFVSRLYKANVGLDTIGFPSFDPIGIQNSVQDDTLFTVKPELNLNAGWWEGIFSFSGIFQDQYFRGPFVETENLIDTKKMDIINHIYFPEVGPFQDTFTFGYDLAREKANIENLLAGGKSINTIYLHGIYFQNEMNFYDRFTLLGGVRMIEHELFGDEVVWSGSGAYIHEETNTKLTASFDQSFAAPTLQDLFNPFVGNTSLTPEKGNHYEIALTQELWDKKITLFSSFFATDYENLIIFVPTGAFTGALMNAQAATIRGVETEIIYSPTESFTVGGNHTYLHTVDKSTSGDKPLQLTPTHTANIFFNWSATEKLNINFDITMTTEVRQNSAPYKPNGYFKADCSIYYDVTDSFQVYGRVENLFNDQYQTNPGFPEPGTQVFIGGKVLLGK